MEGESALFRCLCCPTSSRVVSSLASLMWCRAQELVWHAGACRVIHGGETRKEPSSSAILEQTPAR